MLEPVATSCQPCDDYMVLAAYLLWDCYVERGDSSLLTQLALLLENARHRSRASAHVLILLAKTYAMLNAGALCLDCHIAAGIKYTQLDSLGYLALDTLMPNGLFDEAQKHCATLCQSIDDGVRQLHEALVSAYHNARYAHVSDMCALHSRMTRSMHRVAAACSHAYLHVLLDCTGVDTLVQALIPASTVNATVPDAPLAFSARPHALLDIGLFPGDSDYNNASSKLEFSALYDNRDFDVLPACEPDEPQARQQWIERTATEIVSC